MVASGPSYNAMATSAILAMKDRTGSSVMAITKWVQTEYPNLAFKKHLLGAALKKGAASGAFVKAKASYKVSMDEKKKIAAAAKPKKAKAKKVETAQPNHAAARAHIYTKLSEAAVALYYILLLTFSWQVLFARRNCEDLSLR